MDKNLKIESDIPLSPLGKGYTAALRKLRVGQSVVFPHKECMEVGGITGRIEGKFSTRKVADGIRIWRIK